jgi:acylphosphatase
LSTQKKAKHYRIRGRVQGVGFRYFVQHAANAIGVRGYVRNLDDDSVEVYASGTKTQLDELAGQLWKGPRWAEVRGVDESEAPLEDYSDFHIRS